jgi:hypothetical protein
MMRGIMVAAAMLSVAGAWVMTRPEKDRLKEERKWSLRKIARWSAVIVTAVYVAASWQGVRLLFGEPGRIDSRPAMLMGTSYACAMFFLVAFYVAALAKRAGRRALATFCRIMSSAGLVCGLLCLRPPATFYPAPDGQQFERPATLILSLLPVMAASAMVLLLGYAAWVVGRAGRGGHLES